MRQCASELILMGGQCKRYYKALYLWVNGSIRCEHELLAWGQMFRTVFTMFLSGALP